MLERLAAPATRSPPSAILHSFVSTVVRILALALVAFAVIEGVPRAPDSPTAWTLLAGGDVMLGRDVGAKLARDGDPSFAFAHIRDLLRSADLTIVNLEHPVTDAPLRMEGELFFRADPSVVPAIADAGIDIVSLANNHLWDAGNDGIRDTLQYLRHADIATVGVGMHATEAHAPVLSSIHGIRIGFLAYGDKRFAGQVKFATDTQPGIAPAAPALIARDIAQLRDAVDVIVVSLHAGTEYRAHPDETQRALVAAAAAAGADLVLGHHPHVLQPVEQIGDTWVAWSLGNLVFDQYWSEETQLGALLRVQFSGPSVERITPIPVRLDGKGRPHVAETPLRERAMERMGMGESYAPAGEDR